MENGSEFIHESVQDCSSIKEYLSALQEGFSSGKISLQDGSETIEFAPAGMVSLTIKAEKSGERSSLNIKMNWKESEDSDNDSSDLTIRS